MSGTPPIFPHAARYAVGLLAATLLILAPRPAGADLRIGAWMIIVDEAPTQAAAQARRDARCADAALASLCADHGVLEPGFGVYELTNWEGVGGGPWAVAAGVVRSRSTALALVRRLQDAGLTPRVARTSRVPRVHEWRHGVAGQWRLWTIRNPVTQEETLYISRDGQADVALARGWPIPRPGRHELYPIGPTPEGNGFAFYWASTPRVFDAEKVQVTAAPTPTPDDLLAAEQAAKELLAPGAVVTVEWALPWACAVSTPVGEGTRRRFLVLRRTTDGWAVVRDEVQTSYRAPAGAD